MIPPAPGGERPSHAWIGWWLLASVVPFLWPAWRLAAMAMTDVPEAYLATIPVVAFAWAVWSLWGASPPQPAAGRRSTVGPALAVAVALLAVGMQRLLPRGGATGDALVLWPLWSAATASAFWGTGVLRRLWAPLAYLFLAWPPPYLAMLSALDPTLIRWGYVLLAEAARTTTWMRPLSAVPVRFAIQTASGTVVVNVTAACSGSDSVLALVVLFPVLLGLFRGSVMRKVALVAVGVAGAFVANLLRIVLIVWTAHAVSVPLAFNVVHPLLGPFVFGALVLAVLLGGGLTVRAREAGGGVQATGAPSGLAVACVALACLATALAFRPGLG